ncbi:hypothetical protein LG047_11105 [Methylocystis sp. WRRC1]|nr:hypothetical protein [Methylocystis sp. WRRC1]
MEQQSAATMGMATEKSVEAATYPKEKALPAVSGAAPAPPITNDAEHNGVFRKLVSGDDDIIGLVAYSLYKQNKIDWMRAFESQNGRAPNDQEFASYIIGENTPRRVATYRFLAESTVDRSAPGSYGGRRPLLSATMQIFYGLFGVAAVAALIVLLRFFFSLKH